MPSTVLARVPALAVLATVCSVGTVSYPSVTTPREAHVRGESPARRPTAFADGTTQPPLRYEDHRIAAGTALPIELRSHVSSETSRRADGVEGRLLRAIAAGDVELVPAGAVLLGTVTDAEPARPGTPGRLAFTFTAIQHPETGSRAPIRATVLSFRTDPPRRGKPLPVVSLMKGSDATVTLLQPLVVRIPLTGD